MPMLPFIQPEDVELDWVELSDAIMAGHRAPKADIDDILFRHEDNALLNRAAWIPGTGIGIKTATIFPGNTQLTPAKPSVQAMFTLFEDTSGSPVAVIDGLLVTRWKTAADSITGARLLARPNSHTLTILGAGAVAESLIDAYRAAFPDLKEIRVWNRNVARAEQLAEKKQVTALGDLKSALTGADIVASATLAIEPFIPGEWIQPGTHVDLIGAYRPDMREADDALIQKSALYVDSKATALHDIGELGIPLNNNLIQESDVRADLYDLCNGAEGRISEKDITLFKNGGGAHLDLMTAQYIVSQWQKRSN